MKENKIIFLDRDGVINRDPGEFVPCSYVTSWKEFFFLPGSIESIQRLDQAGYGIIVISNQAGVSKGCYTEEQLNEINENMLSTLKQHGASILKAYYCIHQSKDNCGCRKPKTGLFERAEQELGIRSRGAFFIGDGKMDVEAGHAFGLKTILLLSGKTSKDDVQAWRIKPDLIRNDLQGAVDYVLRNPRPRTP
ncbi:MAG: HAD family hydrolase [Candidatus Omnitrophica bacterium]|nr:HAD family hydrolase [Candidatus Omnitrophota bacterium]